MKKQKAAKAQISVTASMMVTAIHLAVYQQLAPTISF